MRKFLLILLLSVSCFAQTSRKIPSTSTDNTWTGQNTFNGPVKVPSPTASNDAADKALVDTKATDANVVHKTGDETVAGNKTLTGQLSSPVTRNTRARQLADSKIERWDFSNIPTVTNASDYLHSLVTYASTGLTHPDVYYNPAGWNGWKYWMVATPYAGSDAQYENPSLWVSQDGQTWQVPPGVTNPVVPPPPNPGAANYNSDPELVDGLDGTLYLFYRQLWQPAQGGPGETISYYTSTDGVNWTGPTLSFPDPNPEREASPAILFDGKTWRMYYVEIAAGTYEIHMRTASSPSGPWSAYTNLAIAAPAGKAWWHINANQIGTQTVLLIEAGTPGSYGEANSGLYLAWSNDGTTFTVNNTTALMLPSASAWDSGHLYRSAMLPLTDSNGVRKLALWYSGANTSWQIGYAEALINSGSTTFKNNADVSLTLTLDSGKTAAQNTEVWFSDRGTVKWHYGTDTAANFVLWDTTAGYSRMSLLANGQAYIRTSSSFFIKSGTGTDNLTLSATGNLKAIGGVQPASTGTSILWFQKATHAALDLASVASAACTAAQTETITGAALADTCQVSSGSATADGSFYTCNVTAADTVKWSYCNLSGGAIDRASDTYTIRVIR